MHILHIITGLGDGGAESVLYRLCLHERHCRHTIISLMDEGKYGALLRQAGLAVYCLNLPRGRIRFVAFMRLWTLLVQQRPDVVQTWMYHADLFGGLVARLAGFRNVVWGIRHTTFEKGKSNRRTLLIARMLARMSYFLPRRITVCAHKAVVVHGALGYDTTRMEIIPNGYNLDQFAPNTVVRARLREEWGVPNNLPLLGMVGRYDPQKDHSNLLQTLALLCRRGEKFRFVLVGTGLTEDNDAVAQQIKLLGLKDHVLLLGRRNDIPAVMNALDVHVLSSAFGEAFPNVLAEAMACGTPCVTTDVGDAALIVGDTGWVVPPSNSEALADAIGLVIKLINNSGWSKRSQSARQRVCDNFSIEKMCTNFNRVWHEVGQ